LLSRVFRRPVSGVEGRGLFGFERALKLFAGVGSKQFAIGALAYGGESQRGKWMLQLTGTGCQVVSSWSRLRKLLSGLDAALTRVDLCVDFLEGEYGVQHAVDLYMMEQFNGGGNKPKSRCEGDWLMEQEGRTFYVGVPANGKGLRVYEKGKQLGDLASPWVRWEVQFGNRDRVIPLDILVRRDEFFAGAYKALAAILDRGGERIATEQTEGRTSLAHLMFHLKRSYGKVLDVLASDIKVEVLDIVQSLSVSGVPRRLKPSAIASGLTWEQLLSQFKRGL
jgi:phage replication initiation protein